MVTLLIAAVSTAAGAAGCPDLSGTYRAREADGIQHEITLRQSGCERVEFVHTLRHPVGEPETTRETWLLDGSCQPVPETPEICIARTIEGRKLRARGHLKLTGQATPLLRFEQKLWLEKKGGRSLVSNAEFYDFLGGLEEQHRMRYTRAQAAPLQKAPAQKGKAPVSLDASTVSRP